MRSKQYHLKIQRFQEFRLIRLVSIEWFILQQQSLRFVFFAIEKPKFFAHRLCDTMCLCMLCGNENGKHRRHQWEQFQFNFLQSIWSTSETTMPELSSVSFSVRNLAAKTNAPFLVTSPASSQPFHLRSALVSKYSALMLFNFIFFKEFAVFRWVCVCVEDTRHRRGKIYGFLDYECPDCSRTSNWTE